MQPFDVGIELLVHLDPVGVKLDLGSIEQRFVAGKAGDDFIKRLNKADDIHHGTIRQSAGDIARHCIWHGGTHIAALQFLWPGTLSAQNIAETLHQNMAVGKHIHQFADPFGISYGLVERRAEVVGTQNGDVCIVAFQFFVGMSVYYS